MVFDREYKEEFGASLLTSCCLIKFTAVKILLSIVGPTATGKTALAVQIAKEFQCPVISADSRQVYKYMNIGTAKPTEPEMQGVPHHFVDEIEPDQSFSAGIFGAEARQRIDQLFLEHEVLVMAGGSGLYLQAAWEGFDDMPDIPDTIRYQLMMDLEMKGLEELVNELQQVDPATYAKIDRANPHRVIRALEIYRHTGKPISEFRRGAENPVDYEIVKIGLDMNRDELYERINKRVDVMVEQGLQDEARGLQLKFSRECQALQTVGYQEWIEFFDGRITHKEAVELIKRNTRRFAKRQFTWFRRDPEINWFSAQDTDRIMKFVRERVGVA